ncbi:unnamed protein product, partial [Allacma fusca]
MLSRCY